jgi:hypothetical protein
VIHSRKIDRIDWELNTLWNTSHPHIHLKQTALGDRLDNRDCSCVVYSVYAKSITNWKIIQARNLEERNNQSWKPIARTATFHVWSCRGQQEE